MFPEAPIYTSLYDRRATGDLFDERRVVVSPLQRLPFSQKYFRYLAPFYPAVFERFDLSSYDLVVSSTSSWAKGVHVRPGATHVCYLHTVSRFLFNYDSYVGGLSGGRLARPLVDRLAAWDLRAAARPSAYVANSANVAARVAKYYAREAKVVHGPVDLERFAVGRGDGDYFLVVSRLLPYKRVDLAIAACALAGVPLAIVGAGPAERALKAAAAGTRTEFLGAIDDVALRSAMGRARAVIFPGEEDYGLVPLEANASGRPVIAYGAGGALETVEPGVTGEFFNEPSAGSLARSIAGFDPSRYDPALLRAHAERFSPERFKLALRGAIDEALASGGRLSGQVAQQR